MKNVHLKIAAALLATVAFSGAAHAQIVGETSDAANVDVGTSNVPFGPHTPGLPGLAFPGSSYGPTVFVDAQGLRSSVGVDSNGVSTVSPANNPHGDMGYFSFLQAASADAWAGQWTDNGDADTGNNTAFYVGSNPSSTGDVPLLGGATYTIKGVNDYYQNGDLMTGSFDAAFVGGAGLLTGSFANSDLEIDIGTVAINSDASFSTIANFEAIATDVGTSVELADNGIVSGQFFNSPTVDLSALAGIVTFSGNRELDTAFVGDQTSAFILIP